MDISKPGIITQSGFLGSPVGGVYFSPNQKLCVFCRPGGNLLPRLKASIIINNIEVLHVQSPEGTFNLLLLLILYNF